MIKTASQDIVILPYDGGGKYYETYISAQKAPPCRHARFSGPQQKPQRPQGAERAPCKGPREACRLRRGVPGTLSKAAAVRRLLARRKGKLRETDQQASLRRLAALPTGSGHWTSGLFAYDPFAYHFGLPILNRKLLGTEGIADALSSPYAQQ